MIQKRRWATIIQNIDNEKISVDPAIVADGTLMRY